MENSNSKITAEYKRAITDILSKVTLNLSEKVTDSIEPQINVISSEVKENIRNATAILEAFDQKITAFSDKIDIDASFEKLDENLKYVEKKIIEQSDSNFKEIKTFVKEEIIEKSDSNLKEVKTFVKEEIIEQSKFNFEEIKTFVKEENGEISKFINEKSAVLSKGVNKINEQLETDQVNLNRTLNSHRNEVLDSNSNVESILNNQLLEIMTKLIELENDKSIEIELKEMNRKQIKSNIVLMILIGLSLLLSGTVMLKQFI